MKAFLPSILFLVIQCLTVPIHATVHPTMISAPNKSVKAVIGDTVSFRWHYNSGYLKNDLLEVMFGIEKSPDLLEPKLVAVNSSGFASTRSSYRSSVGWAGNLTSSVAVFELYNVTTNDSNTYGIKVEYGAGHTPLIDSVQLQVESGRAPETATPREKNVPTTPRATGSPVTSKGAPETATPREKNVPTTPRATGSPVTSKEPGFSLPRKLIWIAMIGMILTVIGTPFVCWLYFSSHRKISDANRHTFTEGAINKCFMENPFETNNNGCLKGVD